jgi:ATP-dependent DNA helicase RecG
MPDFRVANIFRNGTILEQARQAAFSLLESDADLSAAAHVSLRDELLRRWGNRLELAAIG